jgi:phosphoribosylanthranilate isomerase
MNNIKVKYCGLTTLDDVVAAAEAKVDAIGLVFVKKSPRYINPDVAIEISKVAKQFGLSVVALFADHQIAEIEQIIRFIDPDILQFHGNETAEFCEQFNRKYWKAIPMLETNNIKSFLAQYQHAEAFLLDAYGGSQTGGSGESFKWFQFPEELISKLILAGGINADNVTSAISITGARFIDTSSGIEASPGVKSKAKMLALMERIEVINTNLNNNQNNNLTHKNYDH